MKTSFALSLQPTKFSAISFDENLEMRFRQLSTLGYDGVELAVRDPNAFDVDQVKDLVTKHGLKVPAIGTGQAYLEEGLSLTSPDEGIRTRAIERIESHVKFASIFGAYVIVGLMRGKTEPGEEEEECLERLKNSLCQCGSFAQDYGVSVIVEPLNRYETDLINTAQEGIELIESVNNAQVGLLLDTFHMNIEEVSMEDAIRDSAPHLKHFHVADSNRWAPGCGHLDFSQVISTLTEIGYDGFVSAEILPKPNPEEAAKLSKACMNDLL